MLCCGCLAGADEQFCLSTLGLKVTQYSPPHSMRPFLVTWGAYLVLMLLVPILFLAHLHLREILAASYVAGFWRELGIGKGRRAAENRHREEE